MLAKQKSQTWTTLLILRMMQERTKLPTSTILPNLKMMDVSRYEVTDFLITEIVKANWNEKRYD